MTVIVEAFLFVRFSILNPFIAMRSCILLFFVRRFWVCLYIILLQVKATRRTGGTCMGRRTHTIYQIFYSYDLNNGGKEKAVQKRSINNVNINESRILEGYICFMCFLVVVLRKIDILPFIWRGFAIVMRSRQARRGKVSIHAWLFFFLAVLPNMHSTWLVAGGWYAVRRASHIKSSNRR